MQKAIIALGLAGLLLAAGFSTASAAFTVPPAKSVITSLNSDLTDVRWRRCWLIVGDEGVANGAGATAGAGFVVAEPPSRRSQAPLHGPGESYSDLILRLAELEGGPVSSR